MSRGRCNYSEFTAEEFEVLKECGDAEKDAKQGNSEVWMLYNSGITFRRITYPAPHTVTLTLTQHSSS